MNHQRLLSYFVPITLWRGSTPYNPDIRVSLEHGEPKLLVNGSRQSGAYIRMLWEKAFAHLPLPTKVNKILVLGIGGGTVINILSAKYPLSQITGVDIDQTIIDIAIKYFDLLHNSDSSNQRFVSSFRPPSRNPLIDDRCRIKSGMTTENISLINADAFKFLSDVIKTQRHYDLVVVDLFSGREIPAFVSTPKFIHNIKLVMRPPGQFVINYLREHEYAPRARAFRELLKKEFAQVNSFEINNNIFFSCGSLTG